MNPMDLIQSQAADGFSAVSGAVLEELTKALTAGYGTDSAAFSGGRALIPESLDATLVSVTHSQDDAKLFKKLKREPVASTVHEFNKRTKYGSKYGGFVAEGGDSIEKDVTLARQIVQMKYLQTMRKVTLQMTAAKTLEDAQAFEAQNGTLWLIEQAERAMFNGDSAVITEEYDGLNKLAVSENTIDARGQNFVEDGATLEQMFTEAGVKVRRYFGRPTDAFLSVTLMGDIQKLYRDRIRVPAAGGISDNGQGNSIGYVINNIYTPFGNILLNDEVFVEEGGNPEVSTIVGKPSQVSIAAIRQAASGGRVSQFASGDAGDYYYQVVAVNKYGEAVASSAVQVTSIVAGDEVAITVTDGSDVGTGFKVFRSKKTAANGTDCRFMFQVARTGASQVIYDVNADLPGTSSIYVTNLNPAADAMEWDQFLPFMKFPLYPTNAAVYPFLLLMFGSLNVKKTEHLVKIKNVSPYALGWF